MNLISRFFSPLRDGPNSALGANIFEPRPPDAPRSSLEEFLAEAAECVNNAAGWVPEPRFAAMTMAEAPSSPLIKPLGTTLSLPPTPESLASRPASATSRPGYVQQHSLPNIGTWRSTTHCALSRSSTPSSPDKSLGGRSGRKDHDGQDDRELLSDYYENLANLHEKEENINNLEIDMKGMQVMQKTRALLGQQPLSVDFQLWDHHRQSMDDQLGSLQRQNDILRTHCIKRGLLLLPNPSAFKRSNSVSTGQDNGRVLPEPGVLLTNRHRSTTLPAAVVEQAVSNHRSERKRIPRPAKAILEYHFTMTPHPSDAELEILALKTSLPIKRVKTWFITRRAVCQEHSASI
ncbi:homeobox and leucine zipper protein homez [Diplodia corticola]|uniref:Homeobox and leucine zipper protein homez n=1 Tax=Diplodia corticola TaxID=236234 RepID=A0A1J9S6G2_9PEZI|nr:homeobox and leucine zipper protein homez [Diplodia corticola]OJD36111.1 homeobox and leucine zipper protein homez [Diplodia corticola]